MVFVFSAVAVSATLDCVNKGGALLYKLEEGGVEVKSVEDRVKGESAWLGLLPSKKTPPSPHTKEETLPQSLPSDNLVVACDKAMRALANRR